MCGVDDQAVLDSQQVVKHLLSSHSPRAEVALRKALAARFTAEESEQIVSAVIAGVSRTPAGAALPSGLLRFQYHLQSYEGRHGGDEQTVTFWPEDFFAFFIDLASATRIDIDRLARALGTPGSSAEHAVARALVTVAEVERIYVEVPGALTESRVPRQFLIVVAAALIGMSTGDRGSINSAIAGALSGVGALLLELLADRYLSDQEPQTDFLEDLVLRVIEARGATSSRELRAETHVESSVLRSTITRLLRKRLLRRILTYTPRKEYRYDLAERAAQLAPEAGERP